MAGYTIANSPENLTMNDVKAYSSIYGGLVKSSRYSIRIIPIGQFLLQLEYGRFLEHFTYLSDSAEMPGRAFMSVDHRYYGPNFKMPFQSQYEDMTMTFLCRTESLERQFFDDWMEIINPTNLWDFNYRDQYRSNIEIFQLATHSESSNDTAPKAVYKWTVWDAYPITINAQPVTWADDNFQRLSVTFTYTRWTRVGRDATSGTFKDNFIKGSTVESSTGQSAIPGSGANNQGGSRGDPGQGWR